ncbi:MAG: tetratricopeptide repeat protein, partial [Pedobacter sp.]
TAIENRKREVEILKEQGLSDLNTSTKKIAKEDQTDNIDHLQLAIKFQAMNNYPEAIKEFQKALEKSPNDLYANNSLATINYTQGKYEEALNYYNKVISIDPNQGSGYFNLAITYQALGRINESKDTYLKACQLGFKPGCDVLLGTK